MQNIKREIRDYVVEQLMFGQESGKLADSDSFLDNGIIDSTGVLELIAFVERAYGFKVEASELVPENLDSIDNLANFIERKISAGKATVTHAG